MKKLVTAVAILLTSMAHAQKATDILDSLAIPYDDVNTAKMDVWGANEKGNAIYWSSRTPVGLSLTFKQYARVTNYLDKQYGEPNQTWQSTVLPEWAKNWINDPSIGHLAFSTDNAALKWTDEYSTRNETMKVIACFEKENYSVVFLRYKN